MSDTANRIPQNTWMIGAVAAGVLLLWAMWHAFDSVMEVLSGHFIVVN